MKMLPLLLATCFPILLQAQNAFFVEAGGSTNISGVSYTHMPGAFLSPLWPVPTSVRTISGFDGGVTVGYSCHNWGVATGIKYLETGYLENYEFGEIVAEYASVKVTYAHIAIPVKVDYHFRINKKFSLSPGLEFICTDNLSVKSNGSRNNATYESKEFNSLYKKISEWGGLYAHAAYNINTKLSIFAGPEVAYMLSNFTRGTFAWVGQKNYYYALNIGAHFNIMKKAPAQ